MATFDELLAQAKADQAAEFQMADYWRGYIRGLRRG
jgi:hypothetical protein